MEITITIKLTDDELNNLFKEDEKKVEKKENDVKREYSSRISVQDVVDMVRYRGNVTYSDAVDTIMNSTMFSSDKGKAVKELQKNKDSDYYRAVIRVVKSSMYSSDKIKTIAELKEEEESD